MTDLLDSFKEAVVKRWPVAYAEIRDSQLILSELKEHSLNTGKLIAALFPKQLKTFENKTRDKYNWKEGEIFEFAKIIGLFHDIGKSSRNYMMNLKKYLENDDHGMVKISFQQHEVVSSLLIAITLGHSDDDEVRVKSGLLSQVVLRHHTAMKDRINEVDCSRVIEIAKGLDESIIKGLLKECENHPLCSTKYFENLVSQIRKRESICKERGPISTGVDPVELYSVRVLAGLLVVADNLAATCERRTSYSVPPSYVRTWLRELGIKEDELATGDPRLCLERVLNSDQARS